MSNSQLYDVCSPSDWPDNWQELRMIDNLLRCTICGEFFNNTTQVPSCSHNYCGLCIRRYLSYQSKCPSCNMAVNENQLENNRILDEIVKTFVTLRKRLLKILTTDNVATKSVKPIKENHPSSITVVENTTDSPCSNKRPQKRHRNFSKSSSSSRSSSNTSPVICKKQKCHNVSKNTSLNRSDEDEMSIIDDPSTIQTSSQQNQPMNNPDKLVGCPVCDKKVSPNMINSHLDVCLKSIIIPDNTPTQLIVNSTIGANSLIPQVKKRKPLNKLVYTILSDKQLKQKLKEHGLSLKGDRQTLIKRHREFSHHYNSECSKAKPKSVSEIVRLVEEGERKKKKSKSNEKFIFDHGKTQEDIDKAKENYISQNQDQFSQLIKNIKKRGKKTEENEGTTDYDISSVKITDDSDSSVDFDIPSRQQRTPKIRTSEFALRITRSQSKKEKELILEIDNDSPSTSISDNIFNEETNEPNPSGEPSTSCTSIHHLPRPPTLSNESDELFDF